MSSDVMGTAGRSQAGRTPGGGVAASAHDTSAADRPAVGHGDEEATGVAAVVRSDGSSARDGRQDWIRLVAFLVFVVVVAAVLSWVLADEPDEPADEALRPAGTDDFDRPRSENSLGQTAGGRRWQVLSGTWAIGGGSAYVNASSSRIDLAILRRDPAPTSISARIGGRGVCGIVASVEDAQNYVGLVYVERLMTWNFIVVRDGERERLGGFESTGLPGQAVKLVVDPPIVAVTVGSRTATLNEDGLPVGNGAGLYQDGTGIGRCAFDDVTIFSVND